MAQHRSAADPISARMGLALAAFVRLFFEDGSGDYESTRGLANGALGLPQEDLDERTAVAKKMLEEAVARCDPHQWPYPVLQYYQGKLSARDLEQQGGDPGRPDVLTYEGYYELMDAQKQTARALFDALRVDDELTKATIAAVHRETGELLDPHSAIGVHAARACRGDPRLPLIALATMSADEAGRIEELARALSQRLRAKARSRGVVDGLIAYSVAQDARNRFFCMPPKLAITVEQAEDIMLRYAEKKQLPGTVPIGVPMLGGFKDAFTCTKE